MPKKLKDLIEELFLAIPPTHVFMVGEWNSLLIFVKQNEIGDTEIPMIHEGD